VRMSRHWRSSVRWVVVVCVAALLLGTVAASAAERQVTVKVPTVTGKPVPVSLVMNDVREAIGTDFPTRWETLRVLDSAGRELPYQIDDIDLSGTISRYDQLAFLATGDVRIVVSDQPGQAPSYPAAFRFSPGPDDSVLVESVDGQLAATVTRYGTVDITRFAGRDGRYVKDIGMLRYAGFPYSTYWVDQNLDRHEEKTTFEEPLRVVRREVLPTAVVRATMVATLASDLFPGLTQQVVVSLYKNGEVRLENMVTSRGYADLTKLEFMVNAVMGDAPDARHVLPVFRWLDWADEMGITVEEYWRQRDALVEVDGRPYIAFRDIRGPQPLWWGASYIFASPERWRTNYSESLGIGVAEMLVAPPEVPEDFVERLKSEQWQLEGEWRTGYFRWMPAEMVSIRDNHGIPYPEDLNLDMADGDWPLHMIPGDQYGHQFYYVPYTAPTLAEAVKYLEARYGELTGVRLP